MMSDEKANESQPAAEPPTKKIKIVRNIKVVRLPKPANIMPQKPPPPPRKPGKKSLAAFLRTLTTTTWRT